MFFLVHLFILHDNAVHLQQRSASSPICILCFMNMYRKSIHLEKHEQLLQIHTVDLMYM